MKVISFINMKGGVAKTTLSINIADCLATRHKKKVLLIDVDPQYNATQCLMAPSVYFDYISNENNTILDFFIREDSIIVNTIEGKIVKDPTPLDSIIPYHIKDNYDLIPGSLNLHKIDMGTNDGKEYGIKNYLNTVSSIYDYVIIDTPPTPSAWMKSALLASDYYLIPTKPDPISLTGMDLLYSVVQRTIKNFGLSHLKCCGVVLTIVEKNTVIYKNAKKYFENNTGFWKNKLFQQVLSKRTQIANYQANNKLILDLDDVQIKKEIADITNELLRKIGDTDA